MIYFHVDAIKTIHDNMYQEITLIFYKVIMLYKHIITHISITYKYVNMSDNSNAFHSVYCITGIIPVVLTSVLKTPYSG